MFSHPTFTKRFETVPIDRTPECSTRTKYDIHSSIPEGVKVLENHKNRIFMIFNQNDLLWDIHVHPSIFGHRVRISGRRTTAPHRYHQSTSLGLTKKHSTSTVRQIRLVANFRYFFRNSDILLKMPHFGSKTHRESILHSVSGFCSRN